MPPTLADLRRYAVARTLFAPTTLSRAIAKLGFVQADPIRAPARAQDLTLRHRVAGYRAGDLERRYARLPIEEDFFVNYGFIGREHQALMHPREARHVWPAAQWKKAHAVLAFVRERGAVHPREVDAQFAHGKVQNWFGGSSNASTQLLDGLHYRGLLRIARRDGGVRVYAAREPTPAPATAAERHARQDALIDLVAAKYAPLPAASLGQLVSHLLDGGAPQWRGERAGALQRARARLSHMRLDGADWYWPAADNPRAARHRIDERVRLLAPFDPVVWDRRRFERFWGWAYRFEGYTPAPKRERGYYALPLLWHGDVVGWGNLGVAGERLVAEISHATRNPRREAGFKAALEAELSAMATFLGLGADAFETRPQRRGRG
jgi:uncharacterized protein YcaQ